MRVVAQGWRGDRLRALPEMRFVYEEEAQPEEFFVPYVWSQAVAATAGAGVCVESTMPPGARRRAWGACQGGVQAVAATASAGVCARARGERSQDRWCGGKPVQAMLTSRLPPPPPVWRLTSAMAPDDSPPPPAPADIPCRQLSPLEPAGHGAADAPAGRGERRAGCSGQHAERDGGRCPGVTCAQIRSACCCWWCARRSPGCGGGEGRGAGCSSMLYSMDAR